MRTYNDPNESLLFLLNVLVQVAPFCFRDFLELGPQEGANELVGDALAWYHSRTRVHQEPQLWYNSRNTDCWWIY